jgi:hypothetical protein
VRVPPPTDGDDNLQPALSRGSHGPLTALSHYRTAVRNACFNSNHNPLTGLSRGSHTVERPFCSHGALTYFSRTSHGALTRELLPENLRVEQAFYIFYPFYYLWVRTRRASGGGVQHEDTAAGCAGALPCPLALSLTCACACGRVGLPVAPVAGLCVSPEGSHARFREKQSPTRTPVRFWVTGQARSAGCRASP